jgi:membrane protein YqaA with SNARE-associated domain
MNTLTWLLIAYAIAFVINVIPAFMPATWTVLAFFYVHYHLPLLLLTVGGAAFSTLGRLVLAWAMRRWGRKIVPAKHRAELDGLSTWLDNRPSWQVPLAVFVGSLGPIPSNQLFIAAGLTTVRLAPVAMGFCAGRVISYTVSALAVSKVTTSLESMLRNYWSSPSAWVIQLISLAAIVVFTMIPWTKVLHISVPTVAEQTQSMGRPPSDTANRPDAGALAK